MAEARCRAVKAQEARRADDDTHLAEETRLHAAIMDAYKSAHKALLAQVIPKSCSGRVEFHVILRQNSMHQWCAIGDTWKKSSPVVSPSHRQLQAHRKK